MNEPTAPTLGATSLRPSDGDTPYLPAALERRAALSQNTFRYSSYLAKFEQAQRSLNKAQADLDECEKELTKSFYESWEHGELDLTFAIEGPETLHGPSIFLVEVDPEDGRVISFRLIEVITHG